MSTLTIAIIIVFVFGYLLGHHDLQHGNILKNENNDIIFVDYESVRIVVVIVDTAARFLSAPTSPTR